MEALKSIYQLLIKDKPKIVVAAAALLFVLQEAGAKDLVLVIVGVLCLAAIVGHVVIDREALKMGKEPPAQDDMLANSSRGPK